MEEYLIVKRPDQKAKLIKARHQLSFDNIYRLADGYAQLVRIPELHEVGGKEEVIVAWEAYKGDQLGLPFNCNNGEFNIYGNLVFCGVDENGEPVSMTRAVAEKTKELADHLSTEILNTKRIYV